MLKGDGSYPGVEKAAYSVSQYFTLGGTSVQVRTSGFCKFADVEIDPAVLKGEKTISVTGVINLYQGSIQITVNSLDDFVVE
jgi:DNA/RNA endonuclease YhcR with UshA esterase domain